MDLVYLWWTSLYRSRQDWFLAMKTWIHTPNLEDEQNSLMNMQALVYPAFTRTESLGSGGSSPMSISWTPSPVSPDQCITINAILHRRRDDIHRSSHRNRRSHTPGHPCCCGGCCGGSAVGALQYASRMSVLFCSQTSRSHLRVLILLFSSRRRSTILFRSSFRGLGTSAGKDESAKRRTWDW